MIDFASLFGTVVSKRLGEYEELLRLVCWLPLPPHQVLTFCHSMEGEPAACIIADFAQPGREVSLNTMASTFEERYSGYRSSAGRLERKTMHKLMEGLWFQLRQTVGEATAIPNCAKWRATHQPLLELHGERVCGETLFADYDSGRIAGRIGAWANRAATVVTSRGAVGDEAVLAALFESELPPLNAIVYIRTHVFRDGMQQIADTATTPLRVIADGLKTRFLERSERGGAIECLFAKLYETLDMRVAECHNRRVGDTTLKEYEMSRLSEDIPNWKKTVARSLMNRYFGGAPD